MPSDHIAIRVSHLSKRYQLGGPQEPYHTIRDSIVNSLRAPIKIFQKAPPAEVFWALRDVSFDVEQGEVVGIIGRNGAGKSTLLKILSRITAPTEGTVELHGRVGSLLEVGTGFHPEMTGRENIFLNGSILGMKRTEIEQKFEEIVKFSEIEKFIDTPVKRYSSGMYVRLAFAVAAHLEPEILVVDEVLAVGDIKFQKKCLRKMGEIAHEGRTVLFVSHNMMAVEQLCNSCMLLENGNVAAYDDDVKGKIRRYITNSAELVESQEWVTNGQISSQFFTPLKFFIGDAAGTKKSMPVKNDEGIWVYIEGNVENVDEKLTLGYSLFSEEGSLLYMSCQIDTREEAWPILKSGFNRFRSKIPSGLLNEGLYRLELIISLHNLNWISQPGVNAPAIFLNVFGINSESPYWTYKRQTLLAPVIEWERC